MDHRSKHRTVMGIRAERGDGKIWTWQVRNYVYRWCPLGHLEELRQDGGIVRIAFCKTIDAAIAYTVGWCHGADATFNSIVNEAPINRLN